MIVPNASFPYGWNTAMGVSLTIEVIREFGEHHTHEDDEFEVEEPPIQVEAFSLEANDDKVIETIKMFYDEEDCSKEKWIQIMKEKKFIDDLLNGGILPGKINQMEVLGEEDPTTIVKDAKVKCDTE